MRLDLKNKSALFCEMHQIVTYAERNRQDARRFGQVAHNVNSSFTRILRVGEKICAAINDEQVIEYLPYREDLRHIAKTFIYDCLLYTFSVYTTLEAVLPKVEMDLSGMSKLFHRHELARIRQHLVEAGLSFEVKL